MSGGGVKSFAVASGTVLLLSCLVSPGIVRASSGSGAALQQENQQLQRKVRHLEAQVVAMREELNRPHASQVIGGIGYIVGIFGGVAWYAAGRKKGGRN